MNNFRTVLLVAAGVLTVQVVYSVFRALIRRPVGRQPGDWFAYFSAFAVLNFVAFWWIAGLSGGDALNGQVVGDQCFLGDHGHYTAVSRGFWVYSFTHTVVSIVAIGVVIVGRIVRLFSGAIDVVPAVEKPHPRGRGTV